MKPEWALKQEREEALRWFTPNVVRIDARSTLGMAHELRLAHLTLAELKIGLMEIEGRKDVERMEAYREAIPLAEAAITEAERALREKMEAAAEARSP